MNKLDKSLLYLMAGLLISFTACDDEDVEPIVETEDPVEEVIPADTSAFENLTFPDGANAYFGQDKAGEMVGKNDWGYSMYVTPYTDGKAAYVVNYNEAGEDDFYWGGTAYSKQTDNTLEGPAGQLVAMPGSGAEGSEVYGIMNGSDTINLTYEGPAVAQSIQITNNAYAYHSMKNGDQFAKKFGGPEGNDPDYFRITITGLDENDMPTTAGIVFYLADYRFENNSNDYIVDSWETINLSSLGEVNKLVFSFESSDSGDFGINTPKYFAFDNLIVQPTEEVE